MFHPQVVDPRTLKPQMSSSQKPFFFGGSQIPQYLDKTIYDGAKPPDNKPIPMKSKIVFPK